MNNRHLALLLAGGLLLGHLNAWPHPEVQITEVQSSVQGVSFVFHLTTLDTQRLWFHQQVYLKLGEGDRPASTQIGDPLLPVYEVPVAVPPGHRAVLARVEVLEETRLSLSAPLMTYGGFSHDGLELQPGPPPTKSPFPDRWVLPLETALRRHLKYTLVPVAPLRWDHGALRVARQIRITLRFEADPNLAQRERPYHGPDPFTGLHQRTVINPEGVQAWQLDLSLPQRTPLLGQNPFATASAWIRIPVVEPGVYAVTYEDLQATGVPGPFVSAGVNLFSLGPDTLPSRVDNTQIPTFQPVAFLLKDGDDGVFGPGDTLFFYNSGTSLYRWGSTDWTFYRNPYTDTAVFWLALGSEEPSSQVEEVQTPEWGDFPYPGPYIAFARHERELINIAKKGLWWQGEALLRNQGSSTTELQISMSLDPPPLPDTTALVRCQVIGAENTERIMELWVNDSLVQQVTFSGIRSRLLEAQVPTAPQYTLRVVLRASQNTGESDLAYLDFVEVKYPTRKATPNHRVFLSEGDVYGPVDLVFPVPSARWILEISPQEGELLPRFHRPVALGDTAVGIRTSSAAAVYIPIRSVHRPLTLEWRSTFSLRDWGQGVDLLIVAPRDFLSTLEPLIQWKKQNLYLFDEASGTWLKQGGRLRTVAIEDVFQEFGYGVRDPAALHYFVKHAYLYAPEPAPTYLLLVGDGTYDYRNLLGTGGNLIPPYEPFATLQLNETSPMGAWDGYFAEFTGDRYSELLVGRLPVRTRQELSAVIQKILAYEQGETNGPWRNRVVLVADDDYWGDLCRGELMHTQDSDEIFREEIPRSMETRTLYLIEYPHSVRSLVGRELFLQYLNEGSLIFNVFGHGNPIIVFHEGAFSVESYGRVNAGRKNPLVIIASCKTGAFDRTEPAHVVGEYLAVAPAGIATISATTVSYASSNASYAQAMIGLALDGQPHPLGELEEYGKNNRYYVLLGDPSLPLQRPADEISVALSPPTDTLQAYNFYTVTLQGSDLQPVLALGYQADEPRTYVSCAGGVLSYLHPGDLYFRGWASGDPPSVTLMPPYVPDTAFPARIVAYSLTPHEASVAGRTGWRDSLTLVPGALPQDTTGPRIRLFWGGQELQDSALVPSHFLLSVEVEDSHGVYLGTDTLLTGELGLMLQVDDQQPMNLAPLFYYLDGTATRGRALVSLAFDEAGGHTLRVVAYDNLVVGDPVDPLSHRSQKQVVVLVPATGQHLQRVLAYPNPWRGQGPVHFTFYLTQNAHRVRVKLYTVRGRLIWSTETTGVEGFNDVVWDGRDLSGDIPANGLYYFKVEAETNGEQVSQVEKLLILR